MGVFTRRPRPALRFVIRYAAASIIILLLAHYVIVAKLDLDPMLMRAVSIAVPLCVGFIMGLQIGHSLGAAFALGATIAIVSVAGMLAVVGLIDAAGIVPSSRFEWQEAVEYVLGVMFAAVLGSALARPVRSILPLLTRRGEG
jgi:hypothetical protein